MPRKVAWDKHFAEAKKYSSRSEFAKNSPGSYHMLWKHQILDAACSHMTVSSVYSSKRWDARSVLDEASKYGSRSEFKRECSGAYCYAIENGLLDIACAHMRDGKKFWHTFEVMAVALKYSSFNDFSKNEKSAYQFARKNGLTDLVASRIARKRVWTKGGVLIEASKHKHKASFRLETPGAYKHALENGYLHEACAHMNPPEFGFSEHKRATLYTVRITLSSGVVLYKIGVTNRQTEKRLAGMGVAAGAIAEIIDSVEFDSGRDARIAEKRLHRKLSSYRYGGPSVLKNGNTELFTINPLET